MNLACCRLLALALSVATCLAGHARAAGTTQGDVDCPAVDVPALAGPDFDQALASGRAAPVFVYVPAPGFAYRQDGRLTGVTIELLRDFAAFLRAQQGWRSRRAGWRSRTGGRSTRRSATGAAACSGWAT